MKKKNIIKTLLLMGAMLAGGHTMAQCPGVWFFNDENTSNGDEIYDTVVDCAHPEILLTTKAFVPTSNFSGEYRVEQIPYNPPEPYTAGTQLSFSLDDQFDQGGSLTIDFPFQFYGVTKTSVIVGDNGIVTFDPHTAAEHCNYSFDAKYPITASQTSPTTFDYKNSILGVCNDLYVPPIPTGERATRGMFKFAGGEYPCRHICFSWNQVPVFGRGDRQATYNCTQQVVFYEGTNIIEIHIQKHHSHGTASHKSAMGIINSDGTKAHMVPGRNPFPSSGTSGCIEPDPCDTCGSPEAWRFTPLGNTRQNKSWFKFEGEAAKAAFLQYQQTGNASSVTDTNILANSQWTRIMHYDEYLQNGVANPTSYLPENLSGRSENDTNCVAAPKMPTIYKCEARFIGATGYQYVINTFCFVDVDTANAYTLSSNDQQICHGSNAVINLAPENSRTQTIAQTIWTVQHDVDGNSENLPITRYSSTNNRLNLTPAPANQVVENHIDTVTIYTMTEFTNGCRRNDSIKILTYPLFDVHIHDTMCENKTYEFRNDTYDRAGEYRYDLTSQPGCDSTVTLHLATLGTTSFDDVQRTCEPYTWPNNDQTYYSSTSTPQVTLQNKFGCDSVVTLKLEVIPVHAQISLSPTGATLDNLVIRLTDISTGDDTREWMEMPNGATSESYIYNYTFPAEKDSVQIRLRAISNLGCEDTAYVTIPMLKESIWLPNVFSPLADAPNNVFRPIGVGLTEMEIEIYNRQGQLIQHLEGLDAYWDGTTMNGLACPQGAYVYRIRYANVLNPETKQIKFGTITLIR